MPSADCMVTNVRHPRKPSAKPDARDFSPTTETGCIVLTLLNYFSDGQVRVRSVSTGEHSRSLVRNLRLSGESASSVEQPTTQVQSRNVGYRSYR